MQKNGHVYLVGAGPGDPALLTCKARELLDNCDCICYDLLVSKEIRATFKENISAIAVGYRGYKHPKIDYEMHPEVIKRALLGQKVVRLKAGDPLIFGRTLQECQDLSQNNISYSIVPGITAAFGAAATCGFPLTAKDIATSLTLASGHKPLDLINAWVAKGYLTETLVLYMGAKKLALHIEQMLELEVDPSLPIAYIANATSSYQQSIIGDLRTICDKVNEAKIEGPAVIIIGHVVNCLRK